MEYYEGKKGEERIVRIWWPDDGQVQYYEGERVPRGWCEAAPDGTVEYFEARWMSGRVCTDGTVFYYEGEGMRSGGAARMVADRARTMKVNESLGNTDGHVPL